MHSLKVVLALLLLAGGAPLPAQVLVAPTALFTSEQAPHGTMLIANPSKEPQEVALDFRFGHPASDSLGDLYMAYGDSLPAASRSMASWVRAFPRRFTLAPGQEQVVRVVVRPPANLADGTYWTRLVTTSNGQSSVIAKPEPGSNAQVVMRVEQVTALLYRRGSLSTSVTIGEPFITTDAAATTVRVPLARGGNSPFMGRMHARVLAAGGSVVGEVEEYIAVYADLTKRLRLPALPAGDYTAEITLSSMRPDIPREDLVQMPEVVRRASFSVSSR
jgi:hypothetical protein